MKLFYGEGTEDDYDFSEYSYLCQYGKRPVTHDLNESASSKRPRTSQDEYANSFGAPQNRLRHRISNVERDIYPQPVFESLLMAPPKPNSINIGPNSVSRTRYEFVPKALTLVREEPETKPQIDYNGAAGSSRANQTVSPGSRRSYTRRKHDSDGTLTSSMSSSSGYIISPNLSPPTRMQEGMHAAEYDQRTWQPPQFQQARASHRHQNVDTQAQIGSQPRYRHAQHQLPPLGADSSYEAFFDRLNREIAHGQYRLTQLQQSKAFQWLSFEDQSQLLKRHESTLAEVSATQPRQVPPAADHATVQSRPKARLSPQWLNSRWLARAKEFLGGNQDKPQSGFY
ncbi:hypothetical protein CLCR_08831 [Cladophialophora carrionii]|uniref:Uncharacterized protein n=1 Tax=Cladophialophora carrionii TaxID=86049 RepID=A0A1C1CRW3_9EURO|nr:hypothetical protein CLCR_08831 [Cladophialophora carrionii]